MTPNPQNTNSHQKYSEPIPKEQDSIGKLIVDAACTVDMNPAPGLLKKVYDIRFIMKISMFWVIKMVLIRKAN